MPTMLKSSDDALRTSRSENTRPPKVLYDRKGAAYALSISVRSLDTLVASKKLATRRLGKKVMIPATELNRFARADHFTIGDPLDSVTS